MPSFVVQKFRPALALLLAATVCMTPFTAARAQRDDVRIIRDAETEAAITAMAAPIWKAAGLNVADVHIALVEDPRINAFVAGGQNIFLNTGLILETRNIGELLGVIAHETGHISGGHLLRSSGAMENASYEAILAMIIGAMAAAATRDPGAIAGAIGGGQEIGMRSLLAFSRGQESAADQAGLKFLAASKQSAQGMLTFFQKLQAQEGLPTTRQSEYVRTHPLTSDRIEAVRYAVEQSPYSRAQPPSVDEERYQRIKAKLLGYMQPGVALRRYSKVETTFFGRYARAIALFRSGQLNQALEAMDRLIADQPTNPYLYELKGQMLFENSRIAEAVPVLRKAVQLNPNEPLIRLASGQALLETNKPESLDAAIADLKAAAAKEDRVPLVHRLLATAYGRKGDETAAQLELAEEALLQGEVTTARRLSERVMRLTPAGTRPWLRAQDILSSSVPLNPKDLDKMERAERDDRKRRGL